MNRKTIISKTALYVFIMVFIIGFIGAFGQENTLIGVTTITATLMLLSNDLTLNPIKNTFRLMGFNIFLGIMAYLATTNMYLAIPINFLVMFIIGFTLCYNLKNSNYLPFSLQYLFMLATPITIEKLPNRLLSLIVGAIIIMVAQLLMNRGRIYRFGNKLLVGVCVKLLEKVKLIREGKNIEKLDREILALNAQFTKMVYEKREAEFYLTQEGRIKLNISAGLNRINHLLNEVNKSNELDKIEEEIILLIDNIKICLEDDSNLDNLSSLFNKIIEEDKDEDSYVFLKLINTLEFVRDDLYKLKNLKKEHYNLTKKIEEIPSGYKALFRFKNEVSKSSLRFTYAFRLAIGITFGAFIVDYFQIVDGRWILYTINSVNQPQYELSKEKSRDRIFGTIIGTIIISILFSIFKVSSTRSLIIILTGYVSGYFKKYRYSTIGVTMSAVGSAALLGSATVLSISRILCVLVGVSIAMIISRFIFPFNMKDANNSLIDRYNATIERMLDEVKDLLRGNGNREEMENLFLFSTLIEDRLISNNLGGINDTLIDYLKDQHIIAMKLYDLFRWINKNDLSEKDRERYLSYIENSDLEFISNEGESLISDLKEKEGLQNKVVYVNIIEILTTLDRVEKLNYKYS